MALFGSGDIGMSVGHGISLQGKPDNFGFEQMSRGFQMIGAEKNRKAAAKAKKEEEDKERWEKYAANVKVPPNIDPIYQNKVKETAGRHIASLAEHQAKAPYENPYNNPELLQGRTAFDTDMAVVTNNSQSLQRFQAQADGLRKNPKFSENAEVLTKINEARAKGDPSILDQIKDEEGNSIIVNGAIDENRLLKAAYKEKPFQVIPYSKGIAKGLGITSWKSTKDGGDVFITDGGSSIPASDLEDKALTLMYTGDEGALEILKKYGGENASIDNEESMKKAASAWAKVMKTFIPDKSEHTIRQKIQPGATPEQLQETLTVVTPYNMIEESTGKPADYNAYGTTSFRKPYTYEGSIPKGAVDSKTGAPTKDVLNTENATYGSVQIVPYYRETGNVVASDIEAFLKEKGRGSEIEYRSIVPINADVTIPDPRRKGKTIKERREYQVPLGIVKNTLYENKEGQVVDVYEAEVKRLNGGGTPNKPETTKAKTNAAAKAPATANATTGAKKKLSVSKLNAAKKTKYTKAQLTQMFPDNIIID